MTVAEAWGRAVVRALRRRRPEESLDELERTYLSIDELEAAFMSLDAIEGDES